MKTQSVRIPVQAWYGDHDVELTFPAKWRIENCRMAGHDIPGISDSEIREALNRPFGTERLSELARGKRRVVILFDDLTRPTPTWRILPFVLEQLSEGGVSEENICFVAAFGCHTPMLLDALIKKLGKKIVRHFRVFNHNPYENLVDMGKTSRGTPLLVNREVIESDLRIGVGGLVPHFAIGFSGGAKLLFPGVAGIESASHNHGVIGGGGGDRSKPRKYHFGEIEDNDLRQDLEEAAKMIGFDMKIDVLVNHRREVIGVFAGNFIAQHRAGSERAFAVYATPTATDCDIVITNTYPIESQPMKAIWAARLSLKSNGHVVVVSQGLTGLAPHCLNGRFGTDFGGRMWGPTRNLLVPHADRIYVLAKYHAKAELEMFGPEDQVVPCETWPEVLTHLQQFYPNDARVALYPYAAIQCPDNAQAIA